MHRHPLVDPGGIGAGADGAVELPGGQRIHRIEPREQPSLVEDLALRMRDAPPRPKTLQQQRREHGVAVLASLALFDAQRHALAVDVADLERNDLACAQPGTVGHRQGCLVLEVGDGPDQACDLLATEHHRQRLRHSHRTRLGHQLPATQRDAKEELQSRERRVQRDRRRAMVNQMQLEQPKILGRGGVRRTAEELGKLAYGTHVAGLRLGLELAQVHVLEHALTQRRDARCRSVHDAAPVEDRGGLPRSTTSQNQQRNEQPQRRRSAYRDSGLVVSVTSPPSTP